MDQIKTKVKKWGNSFGIVIPRELMIKDKIIEGSNVSVTIEPENRTIVKDILDLAKKARLSKIDVKKVLSEIDEEFED